MSNDKPSAAPSTPSPLGASGDLFLVSLLILFLELACIRWFPAHVLFLTFFTNTVLLACFLGMSVGCLAAGHRRDYITWTPALLCLAVVTALGVEFLMKQGLNRFVDVGNQQSPQLVFFGTEYSVDDLAKFRIPLEVIAGFFFVVIALAFVGPGQELGRAFNRTPDRVRAYTVNILGSVVGIVLFAVFSYLQLSPLYWFAPVVLGIGYFLMPRPDHPRSSVGWLTGVTFLLVVLFLSATHTGGRDRHVVERDQEGNVTGEHVEHWDYYWSPYYRIDYHAYNLYRNGKVGIGAIDVNLIGHQQMIERNHSHKWAFAYSLPHLFQRDSGGKKFKNVLIIGAGSGNDISRTLYFNDDPELHIDAVEIDPVIQRLGRHDHPDYPYQDPRVHPVLDDGRNFLRASNRKYDLVIYALVDSLVLQSSYSNIRLESYLFTRQAFEDVKAHLAPDGLFVMYNYFRQGWIVARLQKGLEEVFGEDNPIVLTFPTLDRVDPEKGFFGYTMFIAGNTEPLKKAFADHKGYWLRSDRAPDLESEAGFRTSEPAKPEKWFKFVPAVVGQPEGSLRTASDDWPFLYLREPMVPFLTLRGIAVMAALALLLLWLFRPRDAATGGLWFDGRMFFLGAAFMLIETKAVVHMALLFGSTWMVNSVVFFAVLVMILLANLFVLKVRPTNLTPYYIGLLVTLALNAFIPLESFLGMDRWLQVTLSCLLVFAPILFAGVIFAVSFSRTAQPDRAFGANIAGAMVGGFAENTSMLLGFQYLVLVAAAFYVFSAMFGARGKAVEAEAK